MHETARSLELILTQLHYSVYVQLGMYDVFTALQKVQPNLLYDEPLFPVVTELLAEQQK